MAPRSTQDSSNSMSSTNNDSLDFKWSENLKDTLKSCRKLIISRHGESLYNVAGLIGGNSELSSNGQKYATSLANKVNNLMLKDLQIWTSELIRTQQTARFVKGTLTKHSELNEIDSGDHDSMTYEEIAKDFPSEYAARDKNKLTYRYPNGESYIDVCRRIDKVLSRVDASDNLLIVSHQAVIRCILGAILDADFEKVPFIKVPLHTLIEVEFFKDGRRPSINYIPLHIETSKDSIRSIIPTDSVIVAH